VPTDTLGARSPAISFALRLVAWSLALFGLFRLPWISAHLLLPATQLQAAAGTRLLGPSSLPIEATLACSGADALALCVAAIAAYPARWRMRAAGVAIGTSAIVALNTIRIGTLGRAAASPRLFEALHVFVWPAVLTIAIAGIVFAWMHAADRPAAAATPPLRATPPLVPVRFALAAAAGLLLFTLASPLYLHSARVMAIAVLVARAAAALLRGLGVDATASAGVLATPRGAFLVTQECISTPLIPVYLAAVLVYARPWRRAALWIAAAVPLFIALGIARLLVVAVPASIDQSSFFIHAFSQILVAVGMVVAAALWRYGARPATSVRVVAALALGVGFIALAGAPYTSAIHGFRVLRYEDPQGALRFLPAFQFALLVALWIAAFVPSGWRRFLCAASLLAIGQMAITGGVQLLFAYGGVAPLVRDIRAWALIGPALVIATVIHVAPARR
jgi:exosortase/archaeosortase family protein